jgi:hypothetical protein
MEVLLVSLHLGLWGVLFFDHFLFLVFKLGIVLVHLRRYQNEIDST